MHSPHLADFQEVEVLSSKKGVYEVGDQYPLVIFQIHVSFPLYVVKIYLLGSDFEGHDEK